eukprot:2485983-Rhodomonas_salina.1
MSLLSRFFDLERGQGGGRGRMCRLEQSARAAGVDLNRDELVVSLPGARDQQSGSWARKAVAPGG